MFCTFFTRKTLREKLFSLNACEAALQERYKLQAPIKGRNIGVKLTHLCGFWLDVSFFSRLKNHRSLLWLARTHLRMKIYDIAFWWGFLSMYIIKADWRLTASRILSCRHWEQNNKTMWNSGLERKNKQWKKNKKTNKMTKGKTIIKQIELYKYILSSFGFFSIEAPLHHFFFISKTSRLGFHLMSACVLVMAFKGHNV